MLRTLKKIEGYTVRATDGDVGEVRSFYFDANDWVVRYLVVEMDERIVLLSPVAIGEPDHDQKVLHVNLPAEKVRNSPDWSTDRPVSRQHEVDLFNYYQWPYYWAQPGMPGALTGGLMAYSNVEMMTETEAQRGDREQQEGDPDLHSTREVFGYHIHARDGEIGHLDDFVVDDERWRIMYCIVETSNWLPGRHVLVSPSWIKSVDWAEKELDVDLDRETIRSSPEYDPDELVNRDYEEALYQHYGRDKYW